MNVDKVFGPGIINENVVDGKKHKGKCITKHRMSGELSDLIVKNSNGGNLKDLLNRFKCSVQNYGKTFIKPKPVQPVLPPEVNANLKSSNERQKICVVKGVIPPPPSFKDFENFKPVIRPKSMPEDSLALTHISRSKDELIAYTTKIFNNTLQKNAGNIMSEVQSRLAFKYIKGKIDGNAQSALRTIMEKEQGKIWTKYEMAGVIKNLIGDDCDAVIDIVPSDTQSEKRNRYEFLVIQGNNRSFKIEVSLDNRGVFSLNKCK